MYSDESDPSNCEHFCERLGRSFPGIQSQATDCLRLCYSRLQLHEPGKDVTITDRILEVAEKDVTIIDQILDALEIYMPFLVLISVCYSIVVSYKLSMFLGKMLFKTFTCSIQLCSYFWYLWVMIQPVDDEPSIPKEPSPDGGSSSQSSINGCMESASINNESEEVATTTKDVSALKSGQNFPVEHVTPQNEKISRIECGTSTESKVVTGEHASVPQMVVKLPHRMQNLLDNLENRIQLLEYQLPKNAVESPTTTNTENSSSICGNLNSDDQQVDHQIKPDSTDDCHFRSKSFDESLPFPAIVSHLKNCVVGVCKTCEALRCIERTLTNECSSPSTSTMSKENLSTSKEDLSTSKEDLSTSKEDLSTSKEDLLTTISDCDSTEQSVGTSYERTCQFCSLVFYNRVEYCRHTEMHTMSQSCCHCQTILNNRRRGRPLARRSRPGMNRMRLREPFCIIGDVSGTVNRAVSSLSECDD